ncbi:ubiquitin C-terminal hydrolase Ubp14 [Microbotryomycetes sp. JL221]|nr:ubiquitin C-terminal hydrolase Ubp14 [Microbotryomycetes sp. JL221]
MYNEGLNLTTAQERLIDKQREYQAFLKLFQQTQDLVAAFDAYANKYDTLDGGSEAVGDVVEHWQTVFRATHLALASLASKREPASAQEPDTLVLRPGTLPDRLVRIAVDGRGSLEQSVEQQ